MRDKDQMILESLYENIGGQYWCAIVLDKPSREKLRHKFEHTIPEGWTVICNHMTIDYNNPLFNQDDLEKEIHLVAHRVYGSKEYIAVEVEGYHRQETSQPPHVSIAEAPKHMQEKEHPPISFKVELDKPLLLKGIVRNLPSALKHKL